MSLKLKVLNAVPFETALRRPTGYVSLYFINSFYGSYRAGIYFKNKKPSQPLIRWKGAHRWREVPTWLMPVFMPFNTYQVTGRGERFARGILPAEKIKLPEGL